MTGYATIDDLQRVEVPTVDVEAGGLLFKVAALTRAQLKWAMEETGYERGEDDVSLDVAEESDLLMLASCVVDPPLDAGNSEHLDLLRGLPVKELGKLTEAMMVLSGLREEDPT